MENKESLEALHTAMVALQSPHRNANQYTVCRCDWERTHWHGMPLVAQVEEQVRIASEITAVAQPSSAKNTNGKTKKKKKSAGPGGVGPVQAFLLNAIGRWAPEESLAALGLDSLDTVSLRNSFIKEFGVTAKLSLLPPQVKPSRNYERN